MFRNNDLDAVVITAANFVHREIAVAAAEAGLHVFCEKAMACTVEDCEAMVRASDAATVKLMIGHKRRLRPSWARMIELTAANALGRPLCATGQICRPACSQLRRHLVGRSSAERRAIRIAGCPCDRLACGNVRASEPRLRSLRSGDRLWLRLPHHPARHDPV